MDKPTYEELEKENKRYGERLRKMAERVTTALDLMLDVVASFKRDEKLVKRIEGFIYEK